MALDFSKTSQHAMSTTSAVETKNEIEVVKS